MHCQTHGLYAERLAPVQELFRVLHGLGVNGVIPLRTDGVAGEVESLELGMADTLAD